MSGSISWRNVLVATIVLATPILAMAGWQYWSAKNPPLDYGPLLSGYLKRAEQGAKLDPRFTDADGDMVADVSTDAAQQIDPSELTFAPIAGSARDTEEVWRAFLDHLAKTTGKKVTFTAYDEHRPQLTALSDGTLHVTGFNTGFVRFAVNAAGFVPQVALAKSDGSFVYHMQIIVPANSTFKSLGDLKSNLDADRKNRIAVTYAGSHAGFKSPLLALRDDFDLRPGRDYDFVFTGGHAQSMRAIADNRVAAAAIASDLLEESATDAAGGLKREQYRVVYESKAFPRAAFGVGCRLKPDLAAKVKEAFLTFDFKGTKLEDLLRGSHTTKFVPIDYKNDWANVRTIDEKMLTW